MKFWIRLTLLLLACSAQAKPVEIILWHSMAGYLGNQLMGLVDQFNDSQTEFVIKPVYKGEYTDSLTSFAAAFRAHKPPAIIQVFEVGMSTMLKPKGIIKPVQQLMDEQHLSLPLNQFTPAIRRFYSKANQLQAMPFNTSIPVLYYNADALAAVNISSANFPQTWQALEQVIQRLQEKGYQCGYTTAYPAWIHIEAFSALHGLTLTNKANGQANYNNAAVIHHLQRLKAWQRLHYFEYGGRASNATVLFTSGRCVFFSQSSGAYNSLSKLVKFKVGVASLPLDQTVTQKRYSNIIGGAAMWAVAGQNAKVEQGVAKFFAYLAKTTTQKLWHDNTGYIPVGMNGNYETIAQTSQQPSLRLAQQELTQPPNKLIDVYQGPQNQIRTINDEALEAIFSNVKTPVQAINDAVERANYLLLRFHRNTDTI